MTIVPTSEAALLLINGKPPLSVSFHAKVQRISKVVQLASVFEYAAPLTSDGHAEVGHYSPGNSEIIEGQNDNVAMTLDLSSITVPEAVPRKDSQSCPQNIRLPIPSHPYPQIFLYDNKCQVCHVPYLTKYTTFDDYVNTHGSQASFERGSAAKLRARTLSMEMREFGGTGIRLS